MPDARSIEMQPNHPRWSVMIPTFNPRREHLEEAVDSVLEQAESNGLIQIVIVDDSSDAFDPEAFVRDRGVADRVRWFRSAGPQGIGHNWNRCIDLASGQWIHILHQDDRVLPGFYRQLGSGLESGEEIGAAFCRCARLDARGRRTSVMGPARPRGVLESWTEDVFVELKIAAPSMVVRRRVYESLGGFDPRLRFVLDWDMWQRIALSHRIWFEPDILVEHRVHDDSETHRMQLDAENLREIRAHIEATHDRFGHRLPPDALPRSRRAYTRYGVSTALKLAYKSLNLRAARHQLSEAKRLSSAADVALCLCTEPARGLVHRLLRMLRVDV